MKKILSILIFGVLIISGLGVNGTLSNQSNINTFDDEINMEIDDLQTKIFHSEIKGIQGSRDWTIVATYPIPESASGLAYDGTNLYCGIYGSNGDEVYEIDPDTGSYSLLFSGPQDDAYGLTYDGTYFWTTHHPSTNAAALQLDRNGNLISQFSLPDNYMSGIAYDSGDFWVATYYPDPSTIYNVDGTGTVISQFTAPDNQPWDLCLENGNLWIADYWGDTLYKVDPSTGTLLDSHSSEGVDPAGIVYDGTYLWYCDNGAGGNDYLYKVDLLGGGTPEIFVPVTSHDFGVVAIGSIATWNVQVENIGIADLIIDNVNFSGSDEVYCTSTFPITIDPGNQTQLPIVYEPLDIGALNAIATIESNDPVHPEVELTLIGNGVTDGPDIYLFEDDHNYGDIRLHATVRWLMEIHNFGDETLTISNIESDDSHFFIDDQISYPINLDVLESEEIGVWFIPTDDMTYTATLTITSNDPDENPYYVTLEGTGLDTEFPIGELLWDYTINTGYDNSPKAMAPIPDISGDGVDDVIVCSEDNFIRCFNGNSYISGDVLWEHEIYAGSVYSQSGIAISEDVNSDGFYDVAIGSSWGGRLIAMLSGKTGDSIWIHDTHEYGDGGWVYAVSCDYDYNDDGIVDVLAATGDDASDTGPKRVYCLDALTGISIWECPLSGPVFEVIGVEDFTGDGKSDVVAGASNNAETTGYAYGINGASGSIVWTFIGSGSSIWSVEQIDDITSDGIKDVIVGDFYSSGNFYGLDATSGNQIYSNSFGAGAMIIRFEKIDDVNSDGHPDIVPVYSGNIVKVIDGNTGDFIWSTYVADKSMCVAILPDISGDEINDVVIGTLYSNNYCYFLDGVDGTELESIPINDPVDAITTIPDITGDGSWEMVAGDREGNVYCFSGGLDSSASPIHADFTADQTEGKIPFTVQFTDLSTSENSTIISWEWDFDNDGSIDSYEQDPEWVYNEPGIYTVKLRVSDGTLYDVETKVDYITVLPSDPDLNCEGSLSWTDVEPGATVTDSFIVENIGESLSLLDWEVLSYPDWGNWTFTPDSGTGLSEGDSVTIEVEVEAPNEEETEFTGEIILVNSDNPDDTCTIDVSLATPVSQQVDIHPLFQRILEWFPNAFPILRYLLGL